MATFGTLPTLMDVRNTMDPNGAPAKIIELLAQQNPILLDATWQEGNLPTGHQSSIRTGLPTSYWRMANQGVPSSKATSVPVTDVCGSLEQRGQVDIRVARLNGMTSSFRLSENIAHMESMNQELSRAMFYGNINTNPEQFMGLAPRYSSLSAENGENIIDGLGTSTDNTSIWLICWGENTVKMIYPKGQQAGLIHQDLGEGDAFDSNQDRFRALMDLYTWQAGMVVADWRFAVRIANIDVSNLTSGTNALDLVDAMISAFHKLPSASMGKCAWYCNRTIGTMLHKQARDTAQQTLTWDKTEGGPIVSCLGYPIRITDALLENEDRVT